MTETYEPPLSQQLTRIDEPMERKRVGDMVVNRWAGLTFNEYREAIEFSKLMSQARHSVPGYLKQNPGDCLAIVTQSLRWRLEPYWVAQHSYVAKDEGLIAYDSAVHAAILLSSGLLKERPRYSYSGENGERTCTVAATFKGESEALEYTSPPLKKCRKNSPLWATDPDQQLGYYAVRNWGRRHAPELLGGVWDKEEFENTTQDETDITPPSPRLMDRLPGKVEAISGFQTDVVDAGLAKKAEAAKAERKSAKASGEATGEATASAPADPAPQAEQSAPARPKLPETADEYMAYAAKWIEKLTDEEELKARWDGEKDMRAVLTVPLAVRKRLEGMMHAQIAALQQGRKRK